MISIFNYQNIAIYVSNETWIFYLILLTILTEILIVERSRKIFLKFLSIYNYFDQIHLFDTIFYKIYCICLTKIEIILNFYLWVHCNSKNKELRLILINYNIILFNINMIIDYNVVWTLPLFKVIKINL